MGHFSKLCKYVEREYTSLVRRKLAILNLAARNVTKLDRKLPVKRLSDGSRLSLELPRTSIGTARGDSVLLQDCIFVSEEFWLASVSRS